MADQDNSRDEYLFEEEASTSPEYTQASYEGSTENIRSIFKNKRLMLMLAGVTSLWVITYIFNSVLNDNSEDLLDTSIVENMDSVKSSLTSSEQETPVFQQPIEVVSQISDVSSKVDSNAAGMQKISQSISDQHDAIESTYKRYNDLNSKVTKMSDDIATIHYKIQYMHQLNTELLKKMDDIELALKKAEEKKVAKQKVHAKPLYQLYIRAVVDGRAWLVDSKGKALTVSVGEKLTDYGRIDKIFPQQGFITTSSGRVIEFPHD